VGSVEAEDHGNEVSDQSQGPKQWKKRYSSNLGRPRDIDTDNVIHPTVRARKQAPPQQLVGNLNYVPENRVLRKRLDQKIADKAVERNRKNFGYLPEDYLKGTKSKFSI